MSSFGLSEYLAQLAAPAPSPAGGTAAATTAATAASLVVMVGRGSPTWSEGSDVAGRAAALRDRLLMLGEEDVAAFADVLAAFRARRNAEPAGRGPDLVAALTRASEVPLQIAELAAEVAELATQAAKAGKAPMRTDAAIAARLAAAASQAATLLVGANLEALPPAQRTPRTAELLEAARAVRERAAAF